MEFSDFLFIRSRPSWNLNPDASKIAKCGAPADTRLYRIEITGRQNFGGPQVSTISNRGLFAPVSDWIGDLLLVFLHLLR
jgi:hypothetical protein